MDRVGTRPGLPRHSFRAAQALLLQGSTGRDRNCRATCAARHGKLDADWTTGDRQSAEGSDAHGPALLHLSCLKALAFIRLRLGIAIETTAIPGTLAEIDPADQVGASVIRDLAAGAACGGSGSRAQTSKQVRPFDRNGCRPRLKRGKLALDDRRIRQSRAEEENVTASLDHYGRKAIDIDVANPFRFVLDVNPAKPHVCVPLVQRIECCTKRAASVAPLGTQTGNQPSIVDF